MKAKMTWDEAWKLAGKDIRCGKVRPWFVVRRGIESRSWDSIFRCDTRDEMREIARMLRRHRAMYYEQHGKGKA